MLYLICTMTESTRGWKWQQSGCKLPFTLCSRQWTFWLA